RDLIVTGVQTCALPISERVPTGAPTSSASCTKSAVADRNGAEAMACALRNDPEAGPRVVPCDVKLPGMPRLRLIPAKLGVQARRSEERRVGKGCRTPTS